MNLGGDVLRDRDRYVCPHCKKAYINPHQLHTHTQREHPKYIDPILSKIFQRE